MTGWGAWQALLAAFMPVFNAPMSGIFLKVAGAWVACPGRRTITRLYALAEPSGERAHDAYHRFFREADWQGRGLWKILATLLVAAFHRAGVIPLDLDDTLYHKSGRKVAGAGWWRDAVRSTGTRVVHGFGLNILVLTLRVEPPWGGEPLGLPVNLRIHQKGGTDAPGVGARSHPGDRRLVPGPFLFCVRGRLFCAAFGRRVPAGGRADLAYPPGCGHL